MDLQRELGDLKALCDMQRIAIDRITAQRDTLREQLADCTQGMPALERERRDHDFTRERFFQLVGHVEASGNDLIWAVARQMAQEVRRRMGQELVSI